MSEKMTSAINSLEIDTRSGSTYPEEFKPEVEARSKRILGDLFGLRNYGVNLTELQPGAWSAQRHWHTHEDEFVYVVSGELMLVTDDGEQLLAAGMIAGFPAGLANGHHLINRSDAPAMYLEIGDRISGDEVYYPDIDLELRGDGKGGRVFRRRDGTDY